MVITELVGKRIKECMEERGETYTELSRIIGVTRQTMYAYIEGKALINIFQLEKIAKHYRKDFNFFCNTENCIGMNFYVDTNLDLNEFNYRFVQWVESNGWRCGGQMYLADDEGKPIHREEPHDNK